MPRARPRAARARALCGLALLGAPAPPRRRARRPRAPPARAAPRARAVHLLGSVENIGRAIVFDTLHREAPKELPPEVRPEVSRRYPRR